MPDLPLPLVLTTNTGVAMSAWQEVDCDSDLFVPADAIHLVGPSSQDGVPVPWPLIKKAGALVVTVGGMPAFRGAKTTAYNQVGRGQDLITIDGADAAKVLVDCSPVARFAKPAGNLAVFAQELCAPLGVPVLTGGTAVVPRAESASASPTEKVWSILERLAREVNCWIWCDEAGLLHVEPLAPYYAIPPVDALISAPAGPGGAGNNIKDYTLRDDAGERYSHVIVNGQGAQRALQGNIASGLLSYPAQGMAVDPELLAMGVYRPLILDDHLARNIQQATNAAIRELAIRRIAGTKVECTVEGFSTIAGLPWRVTQMVTLSIPEKGEIGPRMVAGRRFLQDRKNGSRTRLTLIEPGVL